MHADEAPNQTADSTFDGDREVPMPRTDPTDSGDPMAIEDENMPEEAGYGYGV